MTALVGGGHDGAAPGETVEPVPEWREAYESGYDRFRAIYPALRPLEDA